MLEKNNSLVLEISAMVNEVKSNLAKEINKSITYVYWNIGRIIVKHENEDNNRLEYGKEVLNGNPKSPSVYKITYNDNKEVINVSLVK